MTILNDVSPGDVVESNTTNVMLDKFQNGTDSDVNFYRIVVNSTEVINNSREIKNVTSMSLASSATTGTPVLFQFDGAMTSGNSFEIKATDSSHARPLLRVTHEGTGTAGAFYRGNGANGSKALFAYSNQACTSGNPLVQFQLDNSSSTDNVANIINDGSGSALYIDQNGNGTAQYISQSASASAKYGIHLVMENTCTEDYQHGVLIEHKAATKENVGALAIDVQSATAAGSAIKSVHAGTGHGIYHTQSGVLASGKYGFYLYSNAAQVNSYLMRIHSDNASSTAGVVSFINDGTGRNAYFNNGNTSNTNPVVQFHQLGTGYTIYANYDNDTSQNVIYCSSPTGSNNTASFYWNTNSGQDKYNLMLGNGSSLYYLWMDSNGLLRKKSGIPTSDTDGAPVGGSGMRIARYYDTEVSHTGDTNWHQADSWTAPANVYAFKVVCELKGSDPTPVHVRAGIGTDEKLSNSVSSASYLTVNLLDQDGNESGWAPCNPGDTLKLHIRTEDAGDTVYVRKIRWFVIEYTA